MKKCKLALVGLLLVLSMGVLVACGNEKNEETLGRYFGYGDGLWTDSLRRQQKL